MTAVASHKRIGKRLWLLSASFPMAPNTQFVQRVHIAGSEARRPSIVRFDARTGGKHVGVTFTTGCGRLAGLYGVGMTLDTSEIAAKFFDMKRMLENLGHRIHVTVAFMARSIFVERHILMMTHHARVLATKILFVILMGKQYKTSVSIAVDHQ